MINLSKIEPDELITVEKKKPNKTLAICQEETRKNTHNQCISCHAYACQKEKNI
jgi:hypothetical protein